jgi:hypothetical protein
MPTLALANVAGGTHTKPPGIMLDNVATTIGAAAPATGFSSASASSTAVSISFATIVTVPGGGAWAKAIDPGTIDPGTYPGNSGSMTNVSLDVALTEVGSPAVVESSINDSQDTNKPLWGITIAAAGPTTNANNLAITFLYDTNRLVILDYPPPMTYEDVTNAIIAAVRQQFTVTSSNTLNANSLILFTNATYYVNQTNTTVWNEFSGIVAEGRPQLTIAPGTNSVVISWPLVYGDYVLQQNSSLSAPHWTNFAQAPLTDATKNYVAVSPPTASTFYRLLFQP